MFKDVKEMGLARNFMFITPKESELKEAGERIAGYFDCIECGMVVITSRANGKGVLYTEPVYLIQKEAIYSYRLKE